MILSTAYFPPVEWFALLAKEAGQIVYLEAQESYLKQTWRSRCLIGTSSGVEALQVPVVHGKDSLITSVKVDYSTPWVIRTERAMDTAYRSAPFFEHYRDRLFSRLESCPETLWELNLALIREIARCLHLPIDLRPTSEWVAAIDDDFRYSITPKRPNTILADLGLNRQWYQIFAHKRSFIPGVSIIDLLFGEGPEAISFLLPENSLK